jgi:hypothetical protein
MDVIGFLCVSLGNSTVRVHDSLRVGNRSACSHSKANFSRPNGDRSWMYYRRAAFCFVFFWMQRIFIKKCFLFTVGSVRRIKRFTTGWQKFRWWRRGWSWGEEVAETTVKRRTGKAMGQVCQGWWRICREINVFFSRFEYHIFYVIYPLVIYLLTLRGIYRKVWAACICQCDGYVEVHLFYSLPVSVILCIVSVTWGSSSYYLDDCILWLISEEQYLI